MQGSRRAPSARLDVLHRLRPSLQWTAARVGAARSARRAHIEVVERCRVPACGLRRYAGSL